MKSTFITCLIRDLNWVSSQIFMETLFQFRSPFIWNSIPRGKLVRLLTLSYDVKKPIWRQKIEPSAQMFVLGSDCKTI